MRRTSSGNSLITSILQTTILKLRLISADLATVLDLIPLQHIYQQFYNAFSQRPSHNQEGMNGDGRSNQMVEEEEETETDHLKSEEATVWLVEEATEDESKEIEIKVKMGLT